MKASEDSPQDAVLTENVPSNDIKENSNQAALKIGAAQTKNSEDSMAPSGNGGNGASYTPPTGDKKIVTAQVAANDLTQILGQSKLTPEEREKKRRELIEKQKEARQRDEEARLKISNEGGVVSVANAEQPIGPRENLIPRAIQFLSSPQVHNVDEDKKLKFLLSKGLTREEIDIAKARMNKEQNVIDSVTVAQPPPVPPRSYQMVAARTPLWKHLILVLLITGVYSAAMIAVIKKFLGPAVTAIIFAKQQLYSHQLNLFRRFNENLSTIFSLHRSTPRSNYERSNSGDDDDDDDELPTPYEIDEPPLSPISLTPLASDLFELTEKLGIHQQNSAKYDTMQDLKLSLTSLATYLSSSVYSFSSWSSSNDPASQVRSEIRSLKGMLISRRNFPKIPSVPTYSGQSSSQTQQQIKKSNEDLE